MKKNDLIRLIREIVKREIRAELPNSLSQIFSNFMGKVQPSIPPKPNTIRPTEKPPEVKTPNEETDEISSLKSRLQEMFNGNVPVKQTFRQISSKKFTNNPVLNEVLNETRPFNSSERMAMRAGGGMTVSPGVAIAASGLGTSPGSIMAGSEEIVPSNELGFLKNVPTMPGTDISTVSELPIKQVQIREGQEGGSAPLESIGQMSALDIKNHPSLPSNIKSILNRDYRSLIRAMDKKR